VILGIDTATRATAVGLLGDGVALDLRDDGEDRPRHAEALLPLIERAVAEAGGWERIERLCVGVGPGGFTGLRLGISTARALAQARGLPVVGVSSLEALARAVEHDGPVAALIDARRGEVFAAVYEHGEPRMAPLAIAPQALAPRLAGALAVGDGAVRFREELERAGARIPADGSPAHRVSALMVCRLGRAREPADRDALLPDYRREPDAVPPKLR
jgi:tRNA threonylcarbamoyladenosine biosynthesis protein TsaB